MVVRRDGSIGTIFFGASIVGWSRGFGGIVAMVNRLLYTLELARFIAVICRTDFPFNDN